MTDLHESNASMVLDPKNRSIRQSFSVQADSQLSALLLPLYDISESTGETFWDTGDSGSTSQFFSDPGNSQLSSSYASDVGLFDSHTTNGEVTADDFAGQYGSSSGSVDCLGGDFLQQVLASLSDVDQGATAENSRLSGFPPSDIPVSRGITPSFPSVFAPGVPCDVVQAQLELQHPPPSVESLSFTALLKDALDAPYHTELYGFGCEDNHAIPAVDENVFAGPSVPQMHGDMHQPPMHLQQMQNTYMQFPSLDTFTPPVSGLPQWPTTDPNAYCHSAPVQAPVNQTCSWSIYGDGSGGGSSHPSTAAHPNVWGMDQSNQVYPAPTIYQGPSAHSQTTGVESAMHGYSDVAGYAAMQGMMVPSAIAPYSHDSYATQSLSGNTFAEPFTSAPFGMGIIDQHKSSKRKADDDFQAFDPCPSAPPAGTNGRKRRRVTEGTIEVKKFGAYAVVNANATAMPKPLVDPAPVDVSGRKISDSEGKVLRTRNYGVMEIDDSYGNRSATVSRELPAHLTCVRECEWTDHPCGLYIEISKDRISNHLHNWHGVSEASCKFQGCKDTATMKQLGRHVETVHYCTSSQCPYCPKVLSRSDAVTRHIQHSHVARGEIPAGHKIQKTKKVLTGYIIPARHAV